MFNDLEFVFKIAFVVLSVMWAGNILLFRAERQVIINPILIIIAAVLVVLPKVNTEIFGMESDNIRDTLYICYYVVIIWGLIITRKKIDIF